MKSYLFPVVVEPGADAWLVFVPAIEAKGAATWGKTKDEAIGNLEEVAQRVLEPILEDGDPLPAEVRISDEPLIAVTVG